MSKLSPEFKQLIATARASFTPDERALTTLRASLQTQFDRASGSSAARDVSDAPLDWDAHMPRRALITRWVGVIVLAAIGGSMALIGGERARPGTPTPAPVEVTPPRARTVPTRTDAPQQQRSAAVRPKTPQPQFLPPHATPGSRAPARVAPHGRPEASVAPRAPAAPVSLAHLDSSEDPLEQELKVLRASRAALDRGDAAQAVALLDQHDLRFPRGPLRQERLATRVLALCALGNQRDARATASELLQLAPHAPYMTRLRRSCVSDLVK